MNTELSLAERRLILQGLSELVDDRLVAKRADPPNAGMYEEHRQAALALYGKLREAGWGDGHEGDSPMNCPACCRARYDDSAARRE